MPPLLLYSVLAINLMTFAAFGLDKWKARKGHRRIPEARLLTMTWATGVIGGWGGMSVFRHKTAKVSFILKYIAGFLAWAGLIYGWIVFR